MTVINCANGKVYINGNAHSKEGLCRVLASLSPGMYKVFNEACTYKMTQIQLIQFLSLAQGSFQITSLP